jgi:pyruvate dehydrogenase E2 component (dihydrolipoamide acetyltransferase)
MVREFTLPDVGEGVAEGELVQWLVSVGDAVSENQPVAEVETDKAVVEVPSPVDGTVRELLAEAGDVVPVGDVFITFDVEGEEAEAPDESDAGKAAEDEPAEPSTDGTSAEDSGRVFATPRARRLARELGVDIGAVEGSGPGGRVRERDIRAAAEAGEEPAEASADASVEDSTNGHDDDLGFSFADKMQEAARARATKAANEDSSTTSQEAAERDKTLAAPATRELADELGVDIDQVPQVEERDGEAFVTPEAVREYADQQLATQEADTAELQAAETAGTAAKAGEAVEGPSGSERRIPYKGVRRTIGEQMEQSKYTAPHVTHHDDADVTELATVREELRERAAERGVKLTYVPFVMKAVVAALREFPELNSALDEENQEIVQKHYYNLGVATATDAGLMVPVVDQVAAKGILQLATETNDLVSRARERTIAREEMQGGTFTITNFGVIGGEYATPIINYPETAILGLGEIKERPRVVDGEVVARTTLPLSLSIDHRIVDGATAARFTNRLIEYLENPTLLLLE